jgi:hypothetical protein
MDKAIAYADDLLIPVKATTKAEVGNFTNMEKTKIIRWSKEKKYNLVIKNRTLYG